MLDTVRTATTIYTEMLEKLNLFAAIRTLPVGVPSLMARFGGGYIAATIVVDL